jgi:hypothetical protein
MCLTFDYRVFCMDTLVAPLAGNEEMGKRVSYKYLWRYPTRQCDRTSLQTRTINSTSDYILWTL